ARLRTLIMFLLFSSMIRRPLCSALFPYTTLFRSAVRRRRVRSSLGRCEGGPGDPRRHSRGRPVQGAGRSESLAGIGAHLAGLQTDRKSTRLNSSHVKISYAVFCLKKKKQQIKKSR